MSLQRDDDDNIKKSASDKIEKETANITVKDISQNQIDNVKCQDPSNIRKKMVSKATEFLMALSTQNLPYDRKVNFLQSRGLTDKEINLSFQKASTLMDKNTNSSFVLPINYNPPYAIQTPIKSQSWFRRLFGPIAIASAVIYICYQLYEKYIKIWLFGVRKSPVEIRLEAVELAVQRCVLLIENKNDNYIVNNDRQSDINLIRTELKSIKSLFLNKFQFPPAPVSSGIPLWQLSNTKPQDQQNKVNGTEALSLSYQNTNNETNTVQGEVDASLNKDIDLKVKNCVTKESICNIVEPSMNSDQKTFNNNDLVDQYKSNINN